MSPTRRTPEPEEYLAPSFDISAETVAIIKQILDRNDIYYKSKMLKAELVQLFHDKRLIMLVKHQADGGDIKMGENKASTVTNIPHAILWGEKEPLCRANLALNGKKCGNRAHAGHLTCRIKAHRAQESQLSKAPVQDLWYVSGSSTAESSRYTTPASSGQNASESSRHNPLGGNLVAEDSNNTMESLAGETRRLKALLDVTTAENKRLQALLDNTADDNACLSRVASNMKSALDVYRGKVDKLATIFEEIFGEDEVS